MTKEKAYKLIGKLYDGEGFSFCTESSAGIAFALTPEDYSAFHSAASMNGYMMQDLLVLLIRDYVEAHEEHTAEEPSDDEETSGPCEEVDDLFRLYVDIGQEVDDLRDEVRFIRKALASRRC